MVECSEYYTWAHMKGRCMNTKNKSYKNYGGRGIKVIQRWLTFKNFLADMGRKPSLKHTIDRIDNNGNYKPSNCKWATRAEQSRNKRNNNVVVFKNKSMIMTDWASELKICNRTLKFRIKNWGLEKALTTPRRTYNKALK